MKRQSRFATVIAALCVAIGSIAPVGAAANDQLSEGAQDSEGVKDNWGMIEVKPLPGVVSMRASEPGSDSPIPQSYHEGLWRLGYEGALDDVNAVKWDQKSRTLQVFFKGDSLAMSRVLSDHLPEGSYTITEARHSKAEVDAVLEQILATGGALADGTRIVTAAPEPDGSGIALGIEGDLDLGAEIFSGQLRANTVPLVFEKAASVEPTLRNVHNTNYRFGGAYMEMTTVGTGRDWCSTGFALGSFNISGARGMMSADHCGRDTTNVWRYSSNTASAANISTYSGMLTGSASAVDLGLWYNSVGTTNFYPYIFAGTHLNVTNASAVRGSVQPVIGDGVCYSGSLSGRVCDSAVLLTGALVCYDVTQCYAGVSYTQQVAGIPAAGHGDSGGPVYASVSGQVYAAGIISGMVNASDTCTGDPGGAANHGRQCSALGIYEPHGYGLGSATTGWGLLVVP